VGRCVYRTIVCVSTFRLLRLRLSRWCVGVVRRFFTMTTMTSTGYGDVVAVTRSGSVAGPYYAVFWSEPRAEHQCTLFVSPHDVMCVCPCVLFLLRVPVRHGPASHRQRVCGHPGRWSWRSSKIESLPRAPLFLHDTVQMSSYAQSIGIASAALLFPTASPFRRWVTCSASCRRGTR
jgi:hypothetical protein